jgi:uncharacterized membrane protein YphA (DoxX/SURF4 family)
VGFWKEAPLDRLFSTFPGGWPGVSLLLLRAVLGSALIAEGGFYISGPNLTGANWSLGLSALAAGSLIIVGFLTPVAGVVIVLGLLSELLSFLPASSPNVFDSKSALIFALTMLLAVIGAGPGRFSLDARVFGRREIIIPPRNSPSER